MEYSFEVEHRPGISNGNADALSRLPTLVAPLQPDDEIMQVTPAVDSPNITITSDINHSITEVDGNINELIKKFYLQQRMDTYSKAFIDYLISGSKIYPQKMTLKIDTQRFDSNAKQFIMSDDLLYRVHPRTADKQLYVPLSLRDDILAAMHNDSSSAHLGAKRTIDKLYTRFWWEGMTADTHRYIERCTECLRFKVSRHHGILPIGNLPIPTEPFEFIAVDF